MDTLSFWHPRRQTSRPSSATIGNNRQQSIIIDCFVEVKKTVKYYAWHAHFKVDMAQGGIKPPVPNHHPGKSEASLLHLRVDCVCANKTFNLIRKAASPYCEDWGTMNEVHRTLWVCSAYSKKRHLCWTISSVGRPGLSITASDSISTGPSWVVYFVTVQFSFSFFHFYLSIYFYRVPFLFYSPLLLVALNHP